MEVIHLKKYNLFSFFKNDFQIPFDWAKIFLKNKGWKQLGKNKTGYAHSPKEQLLSVILIPTIFALLFISAFSTPIFTLLIFFIFAWILLNLRFFIFLTKEKGIIFGVFSVFITFIDNIVMAIGIISGFITYLTLHLISIPKKIYAET